MFAPKLVFVLAIEEMMEFDVSEFSKETRLAYSDMFFALGHFTFPENPKLADARRTYFAIAALLKKGCVSYDDAEGVSSTGEDLIIDKDELNEELCSFERYLCDALLRSQKLRKEPILRMRCRYCFELASVMRKKLLQRNH